MNKMNMVFWIILLCILILVSCGEKEIENVPDRTDGASDANTSNTTLSPDDSEEKGTAVVFDDQYAWCSTLQNVDSGTCYMIRSVKELTEFREETKDIYHFWEIPQPSEIPAFYHIGFENAISKYDDAYFAQNCLVMVYKASSGRCRYGVTDVFLEEDRMSIQIEQRTAGNGYTEDIREWIVFVELPLQAAAVSEENVTANFVTKTSFTQEQLDKIDQERLREYLSRTGYSS